MLEFKEGQTYICTKAHTPWWTEGKEYSVITNTYNRPAIKYDSGTLWYNFELNILGHEFKLKEESQTPKFDLNKLTHEELRIYCELAEDVNDAQYRLDEFIFLKMKNM